MVFSRQMRSGDAVCAVLNCRGLANLLAVPLQRKRPLQYRREIEGIMTRSHKGAEHHTSAADHQEQVPRHHRQAAKHYEEQDDTHAAHQAQTAYGHTSHAVHQANKAAKYHAEQHGKGSSTWSRIDAGLVIRRSQRRPSNSPAICRLVIGVKNHGQRSDRRSGEVDQGLNQGGGRQGSRRCQTAV